MIDITEEQQAAIKKWADLRDKYPGKTRDEILDREPKKHKAEIFTLEEKAFSTHGRTNGLSDSDLPELLARTKRDKAKHL